MGLFDFLKDLIKKKPKIDQFGDSEQTLSTSPNETLLQDLETLRTLGPEDLKAKVMKRMKEQRVEVKKTARAAKPVSTKRDAAKRHAPVRQVVEGEFGTRTNPILTTSVPASYYYLERLRTMDGATVNYRRIGSFSGNSRGVIDGYAISHANGTDLGELYFDPYAGITSNITPSGFRLT